MVAQAAEIEQAAFTVVEQEPLVFVVPELDADQLVRARAAKFIGACLASEQVDYHPEANLAVQPIESLYDAINLAKEGNLEARKMVETNVRTDVVERTIKAGHVMKVDLLVDEAGKIQQHGQTMESVQANSLRLTSDLMRERTEPEAINAFRTEHYLRAGTLQDYSLVVFSRAADNMTNGQMEDVGFFTDTMSCAIQVTTAKDGQLTTESAFVAGVARSDEERHDGETIIAVGQALGVDFSNKTASEIINTPLLIHNSLLPNGVIDLVQLYDDCAGGTFFGEAKPQQDYLEYLDKCREREATLQPKVETIVKELIQEAPTIRDRVHATQRLNKLSGKHMIQQAVFDHEIDPRVFGQESAVHIVEARMQFAAGNNVAALDELDLAVKKDNSSSCPGAIKDSNDLESLGLKLDLAETKDEKSKDNDECEFVSKECPKCHKKNVKTTVTKTRITGDCGCSVKK